MSRFFLIGLCAGWLAACGNAGGQARQAGPAQSPQAAAGLLDKVDGVYKGTATPVAVGSTICPTPRWGTVVIGDGTLFFAFTPKTIFIAPIQPDGTVRVVQPDGTLAGRLADGRLVFAVRNPVCETTYDLHWVM